MAEEVQEGQQLSDSDKAAEKPAQDNPDQETEQKNVQLTSSGNNLFMNPTRVLFIIVFIFDRLINTISKDRCSAFFSLVTQDPSRIFLTSYFLVNDA